ncbi:MAG: hypothetical protein KJO12_05660 [Ignavibacteria bacterium]|nr:hypothetical protein [Ignavibacteria bacterium]
MKRFLQITIITISIFITSFAQPSASLYFTTAFPMGEFRDFSGTTGFGTTTEFFVFTPSKKVPYGVGLNFSYVAYGLRFVNDPYNNELSLSFNRANNFASMHILFQIGSYSGSVRPYFETLFGGSYIFSNTDIGYDYYGPVSLWIDDWAWSYGAGVGLKFLSLGDAYFNHGSVYIDLKVRYLFGTTTSYLDRESIIFYYDTIEYSLIESKTDMLTASIGLYFFF